MNTVISVEHLSKVYRLGQIGTGTLTNDLKVWWARKRGQPNPLLKIGQSENNHRGSDTLWALEDINFQVQQGEVLGIIGRNGAGKSTLLKILSRVTAPTSGQIKVKGRIASLLEVGTGFHPDLTGRENIYLNGAILGMTTQEVRQKFDEIVAFAEVEKFIDTPVKRYSSGMYVRLAFAVAAHLEPEILLIDEVLAVGDLEFQKKCLGKIGDVAKEGRTVLFVSHNMAAITMLCTRAVLLAKGSFTCSGSAQEVVSQYINHPIDSAAFDPISIQSDEFSLNGLRVYQNGIDDPDLFITEQPVLVEYIYEVKTDVHGLRIGFDLVLKDGTVIFRTFDDDMQINFLKRPGHYVAKCEIPPSFLSPSQYYLYPRIGIHGLKWIYNGESRIEMKLQNLAGVNSHYADPRPGVIMPGLKWEIMKNDEVVVR